VRVEEKKEYSDSEAALKLQVSVRTLQEWKQGRARPRPDISEPFIR